MKKILFLLVTVLTVSLFSLTVSASASPIYDPSDMLSAQDEAAVTEALSTAKSRTGVDFYVYFSDATVSGRVWKWDIEDEFLIDGDDSAVILLIEKVYEDYYEYDYEYDYKYELFTYGRADRKLSDSDCEGILYSSSVRSSIKGGRFAEGVTAFASIAASSYISAQQSDKTAVIVISIIIALAAGGVTFGAILYKYKKKLKSPIYPLRNYANLQLDYATDHFLGSTVTRTRVSSGGSRGGRGGGGGSRGRR